MFILKYTNRNGKIITLHFNASDDVEKWTDKLDKRIEQERCGGYIVTEIKEA